MNVEVRMSRLYHDQSDYFYGETYLHVKEIKLTTCTLNAKNYRYCPAK
jgi:hypothetical protein